MEITVAEASIFRLALVTRLLVLILCSYVLVITDAMAASRDLEAAKIVDKGYDALEQRSFNEAVYHFDLLLLDYGKTTCKTGLCVSNISSSYLGRGIAYYEVGIYNRAIEDLSAYIDRTRETTKAGHAYRIRAQSYFNSLIKRNNASGKALTNVKQLNLDNPLNKRDRARGCSDMEIACGVIDRCPQGYLNFFCTDNPPGGFKGAPAFFVIELPKTE